MQEFLMLAAIVIVKELILIVFNSKLETENPKHLARFNEWFLSLWKIELGRTVQLVKISSDRLGLETYTNLHCISKNVRTQN